MWTLSVVNNYHSAVMVGDKSVGTGETYQAPNPFGNVIVTVPGLGAVNFIDVGDKKDIGGYSESTWGVLISYQGEEYAFRYEGGGQLQLTLNEIGQAQLKGNGGFSQVKVPSFVIS